MAVRIEPSADTAFWPLPLASGIDNSIGIDLPILTAKQTKNVRSWHLADMLSGSLNVRFQVQSGHRVTLWRESAFDPKQTFSNLAGVFSHVTQKQRER